MTVPQPTSEEYRFPGFSPPNYTMVPDALFDELAPRLSEAELRVVLYIIRRTFGFKKMVDSISFGQFLTGITTHDGRVLDIGCGLRSRGHLSKALKSLVTMGVIVATKTQKANGSNATSSYALRIAEEGVVPETNHPSSPSELGVVPEANPQDTEEQKTVKQESFEASKASPTKKVVDNSRSVPPTTNAPTVVTQGDEGAIPPHYRRRRADLPAHVMIPLTRLMEDLSRDLNDIEHVTSNISRAANLYDEYAADVDGFFVMAYEARTFARKQINARSRMALFFTALERDLKHGVASPTGAEA